MAAPVRLQTHVWGPAGQRRALLLHGLCSDGGSWWRLASQLADDGWLVVAPDLRGHGRSPAGAAYDLDTLAADVEVLGGGWELVVGQSLGGAVAATLLARHSDIAAGVLVDPVLQLDRATRERVRASHRAVAGGVDARTVRLANPGWDERDVWRAVLATRQVGPDVVDGVLDGTDPWDLEPLAADWTARVHLLVADPARGSLVDPRLCERLVGDRQITVEVVEGAGHAIDRDRPEVVRAACRVVTGDVSGVPGATRSAT